MLRLFPKSLTWSLYPCITFHNWKRCVQSYTLFFDTTWHLGECRNTKSTEIFVKASIPELAPEWGKNWPFSPSTLSDFELVCESNDRIDLLPSFVKNPQSCLRLLLLCYFPESCRSGDSRALSSFPWPMVKLLPKPAPHFKAHSLVQIPVFLRMVSLAIVLAHIGAEYSILECTKLATNILMRCLRHPPPPPSRFDIIGRIISSAIFLLMWTLKFSLLSSSILKYVRLFFQLISMSSMK